MLSAFVCSILLLASTLHSAQAAFVSVSGNQIKLGEALRLKVRVVEGESLQYVLSQLPWQQWQQNFAVELHSHGSERATYYLYPYQIGQFELAASENFKGRQILVSPNSMVDIVWEKWQKPYVYQRQSWVWRAQVKLADNSLRVSMAPFSGDEWQQNPQGLQVSFGRQSLLSGEISGELDSWYQWQLPQKDTEIGDFDIPVSASVAGEQVPVMNIERQRRFYSPALVVDQPSSSRPWKFFDRPLDLSIKPLPSFLPPQVLLGQLQLQPQALPVWGRQGDLLYWQWQVSGAQMSQADFKGAMQQLLAEQPKNMAFEWFAPSIEFADGVQNQAQLRIPLRLQSTGEIELPQWQWRYFDLQSGKLLVERAPAQSIWVLAPWHLNVVYLLVGLSMVVIGGLLSALLYFYWLRYRLSHWLKTQDKAAGLVPELWQRSASLRMLPIAHSWQQWQQQMRLTDELREQLERAAYAPSANNDWLNKLYRELQRQHFDLAFLKALVMALWSKLSARIASFKRSA